MIDEDQPIVRIDEAAVPQPVAFNFDTAPLELCGWSAPVAADRAHNSLVLSLMVGPVLLGTIRRDRPRADVDAHLGFSGPPAGFAIADYGLAAFARISGAGDVAISTSGTAVSSERHVLPERIGRNAEPEPLGIRHRIGARGRLVDLWFESNRDLSLRIEGDIAAGCRLDAYQVAQGPGSALVKVAADRPVAGALALVTVKLLNPFAPLLLVFKGGNGAIETIDLVPFPSLVRGGRHAAERLMAGHGGDDLADTATTSAVLLRALLRRAERPGDAIAAIALDPAVHTGLEPALDEDLLGWVTGMLGVTVTLTADDRLPPPPAFIQERLAGYPPAEVRAGHVLELPADAIPTIAALVNVIPPGVGAQTVAGGMGVVEWSRYGRIWSVWMPPLGDWLQGLQGREGRRMQPVLRVASPDGDGQARPLALGWPLALVLRDKPTSVQPESPFEQAVETAAPLVRNGAMPTGEDIAVLVLFDRAGASALPLIESLVRQQAVGAMDVVVCRRAGEDDPAVDKALQGLFPGRHSVHLLPPGLGRLEQIVAVRERLPHETVLIFDNATILPDPRTLATLLPMIEAPGVTTAGCLVRSAQGAATPLSAGYVMAGADLRAMPAFAFDTVDPAALRQPGTYPVIASALAALVTRKTFLLALEPYGSDPERPEVDDLLLGLRAIEQGGLNLCTTIVSVYADAPAPTRREIGLTLPYSLSAEMLGRITESALLVQKIR